GHRVAYMPDCIENRPAKKSEAKQEQQPGRVSRCFPLRTLHHMTSKRLPGVFSDTKPWGLYYGPPSTLFSLKKPRKEQSRSAYFINPLVPIWCPQYSVASITRRIATFTV